MKRLLVLSILLFTVVFGVSAEGDNLPAIAIMDVAATNTSTVKSQVIYEYIVNVVNKAGLYTIVERSALQAALDEIQISASGLVDDTTAVQLGKLAGAEFILISNLIVDDGITSLSTRIVSVETGQVTNTAMLQAGKTEYIASLASRTIYELLGITADKKTEPVVKDETIVSDSHGESVIKETIQNTGQSETEGASLRKSKASVTVAALGIGPLLDSGDIFDIGLGFNIDFDFIVFSGKNIFLSMGAGSGLYMDSSLIDVLYPFDMISMPLVLNLKYKMIMGNSFVTLKLGGGGIYSVFTYTSAPPVGIDLTWTSLNAAVFPGVAVGYMLNDKLGFALFCDWSMTFFSSRPYTAINAGLSAVISL